MIMANNPEKLTPANEMAILMPSSISGAFITELLTKLGGITVEAEGLISDEDGLIFRQSHTSQGVSASAVVFCMINQKLENDGDHSSPQLIFYEDGDFFRIGEKGAEKTLKNIKGLQLIHFLLQHPQQNFRPIEVFHFGRMPVTEKVTDTDDRINIEKAPYILCSDKKARTAYKEQIEELKIVLHNQYADPHEKLEAKEEIEKLAAALKEKRMRNTGSNEENVRINVQKLIKRALEKIQKMCPDIERCLNRSTVKTGHSCSYQPIANDPVEWILFKQ